MGTKLAGSELRQADERTKSGFRADFVEVVDIDSLLVDEMGFFQWKEVRVLPERPGEDAGGGTIGANDEYGAGWLASIGLGRHRDELRIK